MLERFLGHAPSLTLNKHTLDIHPYTRKLSLGYYDKNSQWMPVYYRSISEYIGHTKMPKNIVEIIQTNNYQLIEVGGGLAELAPSVAKGAITKPIVIDPLDYKSIQTLLERARKKNICDDNIKLIDILLDRVAMYLDPNAIDLIPLSIQEAYLQYRERLKGVADVVVDVAGAIYYSGNLLNHKSVYELEKDWLVKQSPQGVFYTDQRWLNEIKHNHTRMSDI